nr:recombinase family protein [Arthrobacter ulcerisalmonis]
MYVRQSEDKTGEGAAIDRQERDCRLLAEAKGWGVAMVYRDNSISASSGKNRPGFEQLVGDIERGQVDALVVWHLDRLTRSIADLTRVIDAGKPRNVNIASVHGVSIDLGDPTGIAVATILAAIAAMEVQHKGNRQRTANETRAKDGNAYWTRRPFGYDRRKVGDKFEVIVVPAEAEAIRSAAAAVLAGSTIASIARQWNKDGHKTSFTRRDKNTKEVVQDGGTWGVTQVRRLLINPRMAGRRIYNGEDKGAGKWEAILDEETHRRLEEKLTDPRRRTAPDDLNSKYLLSGICLCSVCGGKMYASPMRTQGKEWMVYRCLGGYHLTRRLDLVDGVVEGVVMGILSRPDAARLFSRSDDLRELRVRAVEIRERRDALAAMLAEGLLSAAAVREQAGKLGTDLAAVEGAIGAHETLNPMAAIAGADNVPEQWAALPLENKRQIIRALMTITVEKAGKGVRFSAEQVRIEPR